MAFKFKDLMINVTAARATVDEPICTVDTVKPEGQAATCTVDTVDPARAAYTCTVDTVDPAQARMITCTVDTVFRGTAGLWLQTTNGVCTVDTVKPNILATITTVTTVTTLAMTAGPGAGSLAQLKAQLQGALADVERREREQEAASLPKTVEEADDLERRIEGALQELREHRKTLAAGAKKAGSKARKGKK